MQSAIAALLAFLARPSRRRDIYLGASFEIAAVRLASVVGFGKVVADELPQSQRPPFASE